MARSWIFVAGRFSFLFSCGVCDELTRRGLAMSECFRNVDFFFLQNFSDTIVTFDCYKNSCVYIMPSYTFFFHKIVHLKKILYLTIFIVFLGENCKISRRVTFFSYRRKGTIFLYFCILFEVQENIGCTKILSKI